MCGKCKAKIIYINQSKYNANMDVYSDLHTSKYEVGTRKITNLLAG